jgi:hypothetical protein
MARPILAIDIDGVLNALGAGQPPEGWGDILVLRSEGEDARLFRLRIHQPFGPHLIALAADCDAELTWCTRWENMANQIMSPLLGLPVLPWVPMQASKARALVAWADGRPFCWLDDEPEMADLNGYGLAHKVIAVPPEHGLTDAHLEAAAAWLTQQKATVP